LEEAMTMLLIAATLLGLAMLFGAIAALLLIPADLIVEACRPGDPPVRRPLPRAGQRAMVREPTERRAA
jgi:hypothetical protein